MNDVITHISRMTWNTKVWSMYGETCQNISKRKTKMPVSRIWFSVGLRHSFITKTKNERKLQNSIWIMMDEKFINDFIFLLMFLSCKNLAN